MRWPRRVTSLAFALLLLGMPPWLLARFVGPPLHSWPTLQQLRLWAAQPLTTQTLTAGLTVFAWLLWLLVAYAVIVTAARRLRAGARWLRRLPLPTPLQATATGMAGAAALTAPANTTATAPPVQPIAVSAGTLHHDAVDAPEVHAGEGVTIPGGWLPQKTADQVAAAATLVWLRRRRRYQPGLRESPDQDDPDLAPLPAAVTAVQAAVCVPDQDSSERSPDEQPRATVPPSIAALPATGVAFAGGGAADAARGVLVTALLAALRDPPDAVRVVITRSALTTLLPPAATAVCDSIPALRVTETAAHAVELIDSLASPTPDTAGPSPPMHEEASRLVLITEPPPGPAADRLAALLGAGRATAVVLGAWPLGATWSVDQHGRTVNARLPGQAGPRLCVLDRVAAMDLLTVIAPPTPSHAPQAVTAPRTAVPEQRRQPPEVRIPRQAGEDRTPQPTPPVAAQPSVELRVLGQPTLLIDGRAVTIRRSAAVQTLTFLAVHRHGATTAQLVQAIWPGLAAHTVTNRLYTTLSVLRAAIRAASDLSIIDHTDDRYRLRSEHLEVDLWRLHTAAHHAATTLTDPTRAWQAVIDAYTGDLAAGHTWPWIDPPREGTRRLVLDAYAAAASTQHDPRRAVELLQAGIRVDPYNENLHQRAIDILTTLGDHAAAQRLRDAHRHRLSIAGLHPSDTLGQPREHSNASTGD